MNRGICYTQSGTEKRYERGGFMDRPNQIKFLTGYTVGYPSTAYYPGLLNDNFTCFAYPGPPELAQYPEYTEGTAIYFVNSSITRYPPESEDNNVYNAYIGYTKIYNLMSHTPPYGYVLDENGDYTYIAEAKIYSCNEDVKYFNAINTINGGTVTIKKEFRYKKKDSKVYVMLSVSNDIIINGNIYHAYESPTINIINLESGDGSVMNILVGLDSNHHSGEFDILFKGVSISNIKTYLLVNNNYYDVTNTSTSGESKRCYISKYENRFHNVGYMYTTAGFDYTFRSDDWENNSLFTQEKTKDSSGEYIPSNVKAKFVVKFALSNGYYHQDCQLTVDVTTNK